VGDGVRQRDLARRFAGLDAAQSFARLVIGQLRLATETPLLSLGTGTTFICPFEDQRALKLRRMQCTAYRRLCGHCGYAESHVGCGTGRGPVH
jgi:hypothetical protein